VPNRSDVADLHQLEKVSGEGSGAGCGMAPFLMPARLAAPYTHNQTVFVSMG